MSRDTEDMKAMLAMKRIAVVGLSNNPARPSYGVAQYMMAAGYEIIPVNPGHEEMFGLKCYPTLADIPDPVDVVDVFRRPEHTPEVAKAAVAIGAKGLWLQQGIGNAEARQIATEGGLLYTENRCIKIEHAALL